ncbi:MAG: aldehyde dehydrogenase family protein, partial [Gammaproteobacteria bacterium]|nr:aldehyde dehydrogenase family protein [Gammaproteobacteria bacterium]
MTAQAVINTPSGETAFQPVKDAQQARTLVQGAREGGLDLAKVPLRERRRLIAELQASVLTHREWLIERIVAETGKSRTDALVSEIMGVLDYLHWLHSRGWKALRDEKVGTPLLLMGKSSRIWHEPLGVVLVISPWNYPFHIALTTMAAAL